MRILRHQLHFRVAFVALLLVSWIIFTNHCALGLMQPTAEAAKTSKSCCGGIPGPKHDAPDSPRACCNIKVTSPSNDSEVKFDAATLEVQVFALAQLLAAPQTEPQRSAFVFDHGPPRCMSFAESVLQRSLLSHAPPLAV